MWVTVSLGVVMPFQYNLFGKEGKETKDTITMTMRASHAPLKRG